MLVVFLLALIVTINALVGMWLFPGLEYPLRLLVGFLVTVMIWCGILSYLRSQRHRSA